MTKEELKDIIETALWKYYQENSSLTYSSFFFQRWQLANKLEGQMGIKDAVSWIMELVDK